MRWILALWGLPLLLFWGWYFLSYHDINFGTVFFSRAMHDLLFRLYGQILGLDPATIPPMVAKACVVDTIFIFAILAFRRRRAIAAWIRATEAAIRRTANGPEPEAGPAPPGE